MLTTMSRGLMTELLCSYRLDGTGSSGDSEEEVWAEELRPRLPAKLSTGDAQPASAATALVTKTSHGMYVLGAVDFNDVSL